MEKYLADRLYALIYRMCQVQAFSSRLHARGFPAIGKYEPKTPPRTAGVTKYVIGFGRCSGLARRFCRERRPVLPGDRSHELPHSRAPQGRAGLADAPLSPRPHFRFCRPGRGTSPDGYNTRGIRLSFSLSFFGALPGLQPAGAFRSPGSETERCGPEDRCARMPNRPGMPVPVRSAGLCPSCRLVGGILFR